jgi:hypothetical protein
MVKQITLVFTLIAVNGDFAEIPRFAYVSITNGFLERPERLIKETADVRR